VSPVFGFLKKWDPKIFLTFTMSEEHVMGPSMSVTCLETQGHCWSALLKQLEPRALLAHTVAAVISDLIVVIMTLDTTFAS
jgi:hypothetical protein